jgi:membrane fusion protein (multidrug efflux system)
MTSDGPDAGSTIENARPRGLSRFRWPAMIGGPLIILAVVAWVVLTGGKTQSTDDAYVQAGKAPISAAIAGRVIEVDVVENQRVKAGQVLFKLDPADEEAAIRRADAGIAAARLQVTSLRAAYDEQAVALASAQRTADFATREAVRQKALLGAGISSAQQVDEAKHSAELAVDQVALARQRVATALANLGGTGTSQNDHPAVQQATAGRDVLQLNLTHTVVIAPADGVVARVDQLQVGAYVNAAQTLFYLITGEPWVEANFKEDQLVKMRVGQHADIRIDAYGHDALAGRVASFSPGAGSAFSALPAQNATGNWVKVVQRLPVRIAFDKPPPDVAARAGLSAKVTVDVRPAKAR